MIYPETYFDKAVDDALEEMSKKENKTMANEFENLKLGTEEFAKVMKESFDKWSKDFEKIGEQMQTNAEKGVMSFIDFDDMPTEYSGIMRLKADADKDISNILNALLYNGYEVTMRLEDATEAEKELDGADKFVVIEYEEVE